MPRFVRRFLAIVLLLGTWALVGSDRAPVPVTVKEAVAGPQSKWQPPSALSRQDKPTHDLSALRVFTKVILYVKDNYVDPKRVKPKEMMISALEYVEKSVPDVLVDGSADSGRLKLNVNGKAREFDISHVDSLWKMSFTLKDVFDFIAKNMRPMEDTREVEYAAVNGMLSTLDPHSVLLRPDMYREMKLTTKGEFGGLGFVIQMKEGNLTVVRVLPKTPAYKAGIKKGDVIAKINEESTVNLDINEAVSKLRGPVDSKVTITVVRAGWDKPQAMTLTRALINIESVLFKLLAGNVGYVRLKNFQGNTTRDLQDALRQLQAEAEPKGGMKGLVLDLRGNPGGLLEQAIQVSDLFLSQGTIVATVGLSDKLREEKKAHADDNDRAWPMVVLVNAASASASEIVAGALKNLDRAVIVGRQTFGKGSVQVLYDFPDESALKLTIAKYLTPGDISIQEVGIVPDIELVPTRVTKDRVDVFAPRKTVGEADLDHHFGNPSSDKAATRRDDVVGKIKPSESLKYLKDEPKEKVAARVEDPKHPKNAARLRKGKEPAPVEVDTQTTDAELDDQLDAEAQDEIKEDFEVLFARDFVLKAPFTERDRMLEAAKPFIDQKRREEEERINSAISALGIDWSPGPTPKSALLAATLKPGPTQKIEAGDVVQLELTVENRGQEVVKRLRAWTESENAFLDRREFVFGALKPGEKRSWTVPVKLPKDLISRRDDVTVKLFDDHAQLPDTLVSELNFVELPRPAFAFGYQVIDTCQSCNGDGLVQLGEQIQLLVDVTNVGPGKALDSFAQIKNAADQHIFIEKGRFKLGELAPGETKTARFQLEVKRAYRGDSFPLRLAIIDEPLEEYSTEKLEIDVADEAVRVEPSKGLVRLGEKAKLYGSASPDASPLATLPKGAVLSELGRASGRVKVSWDDDRFAFVDASEAKETKGKGKATATRDVSWMPLREPPQISLSVDPSLGGVVAEGDRFVLSGVVSNPKNLLDVYVLVNDQKVFFKGADGEPKIRFSTEFALKEGNNSVLVVARESQDFATRKTVVIRRRPAAIAQKLGRSLDAPKQ